MRNIRTPSQAVREGIPACRSELEADLIDPKTLQAPQACADQFEVRRTDITDCFQRNQVTVKEAAQHVANRLTFARQPHQDRASIHRRAFVVDIARFDQLLEIVGHVRSEIMTAGAQLAGGQLLVSNIKEQKRLDTVDFALIPSIKLVLDDIQQLPVQALDKTERLEIKLAERLVPLQRCSYRLRLRNCR